MADDGPLQRGFTLQHQRVVLDIELPGVIKGSAFLTIDPRNPSLRTIHLHASHVLDIHQVTLASPTNVNPLLPTPASYALSNPFQPLPTREPPIDLRSHPEIKRKTWSAMSEQDEGELAISVSGGWVRLLEGETRLAPIEIRIDYRLVVGRDVVDGIVFQHNHVFTTDSPRIWTPCVDNLWERCTWELDFIVPRTIADAAIHSAAADAAAMVVSSGELQEQVTHPHNPNKVIFSYLQTIPTSVQHIAFAVGPFQLYALDRILIFCLPEDYDEAVAAGSTLHKALSFFSTEFGTYPYQDFKAVFIPDAPVTTSAALAIVPTTLLHPPNVIEQAITTRETLSLCLAQQWVGINIVPRTLSDTWIVNGLALYIHSLFLRLLFGNNEYRFRLRRDIERCVRQDIGKDPICVPGTLAIDTSFINAKSPLVLHILDKHLAKAGTSLGLSRVIPRIFLAAFSDELSGNTLSTQYFFRACRKISSMDLSTFADQWVYGSRCPHFRITSNFIRKKFTVELNVTQTPLFEGSLTVRIHEADGAPFEHVLDIKQPSKTFNLPFNTKYKRTRRSGRIAARFNQLQEDLAADEPESMAEVFAYPPWDDDEIRADWRVADWSDENATAMLGEVGGYEWIRIDPELEWLATFEFVEKPWYWISQLQGDRDVAIQNMRLYATPVVASELAKTVLVTNYYYRVRMEAVRALVTYNTSECDYIGLFLLLKLFDELYGSQPNDFSSFPDYFVKKTLITALAELRDPTTRTTWPQVRELLLNLLRSNDNATNQYSDSHYLATLITAIGNAFSASDDDSARGDLDRAMTMDRLVPSYHNLVTQAGLQTHLKMILAGQRTNDPKLFLAYTRDGNFKPVRVIAFDCLLLCRPPGRSLAIARYLLDVVRTDSSLGVRRHVAKALSEAILMSLAVGEVFIQPPGVVEGDEAELAERQNLLIVKALRKEFAPRADFKQSLQASLISSFTDADHDVRFALLKVAEMITSSQVEPLPGNLITIQTPVETPSLPTPRIRISMGDAKEYFPPMASAPPPAPVKLTLSANKKVAKSQTRGLLDSDLTAINIALAKLRADKRSTPFRHPVDPVRDHAPDYNVVIKAPMDLSTAAAKLESGMYSSRQDFAADMRLIVSNCYAYNKKGDPMYKAGQVFEAFFNNMWNKTETTLSSTLQPPPISAPPSIPALAPTPAVAPPRPQPKLIIRPPSESVPPMAPPPVPLRKAEKEKPKPPAKRKSHGEVDAFLGEELDAIERIQPRPASPEKPPKKVKPVSEKPAIKIQPPVVPLAKAAAAVPKAPAATPKAPAATPKPPASAPAPVPFARPRPPSDLPPTVQNTMSFKSRRAKGLIATLSKDARAVLFLHPVDPIRDGCPTYLDEIKEPMDFGTISTRIDAKHYKTMGQFAYDIELVFNNCRQFNPPGDITALADGLEAVYWKEWPKVVSPKMTGDEKKAMMSLINRALKEPISLFFREAVDPVALGIPQYFDIIPKEDARDLSLIKTRLNSSQYSTMHQLDEDVELMLENARIFNGEGPVVDAANVLGKWWTEQRGKME